MDEESSVLGENNPEGDIDPKILNAEEEVVADAILPLADEEVDPVEAQDKEDDEEGGEPGLPPGLPPGSLNE